MIVAALVASAVAWGAGSARAGGEIRVRSAHFSLVVPRGVEPGALLDALEEAYEAVRSRGLKLPSTVHARTYATTDEFVRGSRVGLGSMLAAARGEGIHLQPVALLLRRPDARSAYRHELVHVALEKSARRGLPRWLNEGLAMTVAGEKHPEQAGFADLDRLNDTLARSRNYITLRSAYAVSERLVSGLIAVHGLSGVLALTRSVAGGSRFPETFRRLTGSELREWGRRELARGKEARRR